MSRRLAVTAVFVREVDSEVGPILLVNVVCLTLPTVTPIDGDLPSSPLPAIENQGTNFETSQPLGKKT